VPHFIPDPIYGTTELDQSLENLLRIPEIAEQKRRMERIKSLGLIHISFPSATHSKWEHHLGMTHLAGQIGLNKENKKRLQTLCLLGGIGHLPYTYATEEAVLLAARLSPPFRRSLERYFAEVWQMVSEDESSDASAPYKQLIDGMQVVALHAWLSAFKFKRLPQAIDIGDRKKLIKERISIDSELNKLYRFVARVDYVQRDLYYTGLARFALSAQGFLRRYQDSVEDLFLAPASNLIDQLRSYLTDSLYFEVRSATIEALFTKKLADFLVLGAISLDDLLVWHDNDLDSGFEKHAGAAWWADIIHTQYSEICRSKVHFYRQFDDDYVGRDTLRLERNLVGLKESATKSVTRYPANKGFVVLCKNSFNPQERTAATDVVLSVGKQPTSVTPVVEIIHRLEQMRRERVPRGRPRAKKTLAEDLLSYVLAAPLHSDYSVISRVFASGVGSLPNKKRLSLRRVLNSYYYYLGGETDPAEPEYWDYVLTTLRGSGFLNERPKWIGEILRASVRDSKKDLAEIVEVASWIEEHSRLNKERISWILPNVHIESDLTGSNQIDVCSVFVRGKTTVIRLIECTKSDSEDKAVDDLEKLEKIKSKCRDFNDLSIEQLVYGASRVREHFAPTQQLLDRFRIKLR
jgi:hypothetical protein